MDKEVCKDFTKRFGLLMKKHPIPMTVMLSNIFTMRSINNKSHDDFIEIAISEFINNYMYDFRSIKIQQNLYIHGSKDLYRTGVVVENKITNEKFSISLKAYGNGPLQLLTDKNFQMYPLLETHSSLIENKEDIQNLFNHAAFSCFSDINVFLLIYDEKKQRCNILVFDTELARDATVSIKKESEGSGRKRPVYRFSDKNNQYICEVRYGGANASALQRGLWTNTKNALPYFNSVTNGWIDYSHNHILVHLFSHALISSSKGHEIALAEIKQDILRLKQESGIRG